MKPNQYLAGMLLLLSLGVAMTSVAQRGARKSENPIATTVCEIIQDPSKYRGQLISIRADVLSDFKHGILLIDKGCDGGVIMDAAESVRDHEDYREFMRALISEGGIVGTASKKKSVSAIFVGVFQPDPKGPKRQMLLDVEQVSGIEVHMLPSSETNKPSREK